jgi:hypothetical protein
VTRAHLRTPSLPVEAGSARSTLPTGVPGRIAEVAHCSPGQAQRPQAQVLHSYGASSVQSSARTSGLPCPETIASPPDVHPWSTHDNCYRGAGFLT